MPLGLIVYDARDRKGSEGSRKGDGPAARPRARVRRPPRFIKRAGIRNTVWLTADVHYTAAHYYDPNKAGFQDFDPFWEFVSGPLHAGTFGRTLDNTFGPQVVLPKAPGQAEPAADATACSSSATWRSTVRPK